ncbi:MAG: hypothetical protein PWP23_78 [Candidatus Sumerlaeota bacterium]|nr:hypothetical protein [Candidatus Sumerlaeota bacterium]
MDARPGRTLIAAGIAGTLLHLGYVLFAPIPFLETRAIVDDTFYYWMIARRFWTAGFFTFDGLHPTNGFQPLWQWMLLPFGLLARDAQLRVSLALAALCYQGAAWLLALWPVRCARLRPSFYLAAVALWVNARFVFEYASSGMEFGLYLLVSVWGLLELVRLVEAWRDGDAPGLWRLALATALLPLARVDGLGLSGVLWAVALLASPARRRGSAVAWGLACLVPFVVWVLWNHRVFGSPLPVSGTVKRLDRLEELRTLGVEPLGLAWWTMGLRDTAVLLAGNVLRFFGGWLPPGPWPRLAVVVAGFVGLGACAFWTVGEWSVRSGWRERLRPWWPAGVLLGFAVIQASVYSFAIPRGTHYAQWYYGPAYVGLALAAGAALAGWRTLLPTVAVAWMGVQLVAFLCLTQPIQVPSQGAYAALEELDRLTEGEETLVGSWNAGIVAFRAPGNLRVVNLDGLVNSTEFAINHAAGKDVRPYLVDERIEYLVDYATNATPEAISEVRLGANESGVALLGESLYLGPPPAGPAEELRQYFVMRVKVE